MGFDKLPGTILWLPKYTNALFPLVWKFSFMALLCLACSFCDLSFPIISSTSLPDTVSLPVYCQPIKEYDHRIQTIPLASYAIQDPFQMCSPSFKSFLLLFSALFKDCLCFFPSPVTCTFPFSTYISIIHSILPLPRHILCYHWQNSSVYSSPRMSESFTGPFHYKNQTREHPHLFISSSC